MRNFLQQTDFTEEEVYAFKHAKRGLKTPEEVEAAVRRGDAILERRYIYTWVHRKLTGMVRAGHLTDLHLPTTGQWADAPPPLAGFKLEFVHLHAIVEAFQTFLGTTGHGKADDDIPPGFIEEQTDKCRHLVRWFLEAAAESGDLEHSPQVVRSTPMFPHSELSRNELEKKVKADGPADGMYFLIALHVHLDILRQWEGMKLVEEFLTHRRNRRKNN